MKRFKNKNILVTGGARGIGKAIVRRFIDEGARVLFTYYLSEIQAKIFLKELKAKHAQAYKLDVRNRRDVRILIGDLVKEYGKIDILINNAGITKDNSIEKMKHKEFKDVIDTNLVGVFNVTKAVIPYMISRKEGKIINISSISAIRGIAYQTNYSASKAAILGFMRSLAREVGRFNIKVNAVCPGFIETDMFNKLSSFSRNNAVRQIPLSRIGRPEEVAGLVAYLSSREADYITGQSFIIDGGLSI